MNFKDMIEDSNLVEKEMSFTQKLEERYISDLVEIEDLKDEVAKLKAYIIQLELSLTVQGK